MALFGGKRKSPRPTGPLPQGSAPDKPGPPSFPPPPSLPHSTPPGGVMGAAGMAGATASKPASGVDALLADVAATAAPPSAEKAPATSRMEKLAAAVEGARKRGSQADIRKWLNLLGMLAIGFGIATIVLGWYGASHSPYLFQEIPYLISGGLLGLALVFGGGVLVLSSWHLRQVQEASRNTAVLVRSIDRLERVMRATLSAPMNGGPGPSHPHDTGAGGSVASQPPVSSSSPPGS
jgi:hypothetical protein